MEKSPNQQTPQRSWHLLDASKEPLGRLSVKIAKLLCGKGKVNYLPNLDLGDYVVVVNAASLLVTGRKEEKKIYYRYSGYPGGLKEESLKSLKARRPEEVLRHAVLGMLSKNKLLKKRMARLLVYRGAEHPHGSQFK
ncbi:MAG: 50S ribosomal protein L13 [Patescibacteria group bacterium]|nr:50S ribosomal protein L13 [Patescibacteria group bacterium]